MFEIESSVSKFVDSIFIDKSKQSRQDRQSYQFDQPVRLR